MEKRTWAVIGLFLSLAVGFSSFGANDASGQGYKVITQSFASQEINPGGTWKIYLKASNPDGEMMSIYDSVDQPGVGV